MALAALFGALALFWISTRQFPLPVRALIWLGGAGLLAWAAFGHEPQSEFGLWRALHDAWAHRDTPNDAAIIQALRRNAITVARFVPQLSDFFVVAGGLLGTLALLAFTRGEQLEKVLRPAILTLVGFIAGSAATLTIVAIGLGGHVKPRSYFGYITAEEVHDGDTFRMGEASLRLYGVDAPELDQACLGLEESKCGETARVFLVTLLADKLVQCDQMLSQKEGRPRDSFGRAFVRCWVSSDTERRRDLASELIGAGYAVQYEGRDYRYNREQAEAANDARGLLSGCTLRPDMWRNNDAAREAFMSGQPLPAGVATIGNCQPPPTPP